MTQKTSTFELQFLKFFSAPLAYDGIDEAFNPIKKTSTFEAWF
jgi:hypothetical protein